MKKPEKNILYREKKADETCAKKKTLYDLKILL